MTGSGAVPVTALPVGSRILHIGPHKTATTALQASLWDARQRMLASGVRLVGRSRNPSPAVRAVVEQNSPYGSSPPAIGAWKSLVAEFRRSREPRTLVSSEFFAYARPEHIRRIAGDLDLARLQVVVTLRPLARIIPAMWQQNVQGGSLVPFQQWLDGLLTPPERAKRSFWMLERHDALLSRWAAVVGPDHATAVVVDDHDHGVVLRAFEGLLGLPEGTLAPAPDDMNRSLTLPEAEAVRAFNVAFNAEGLPRDLHARTMRFGAAQLMKRRVPPPDEPPVRLPSAAVARIDLVQQEIVDAIAAAGVRVVGDLGSLTGRPERRATSATAGDGSTPASTVPAEVAASMAMGILEVTGVIRQARLNRGPFRFAEPVEVIRVPTYQLVGAIGTRVWRAMIARLLRRGPGIPEPEPTVDDG